MRGLIGRDGLERQHVGQHATLDLAVANVLVDDVRGERGDPGVERALAAVTIDRPHHLHHRLLGQILVLGIVPAQQTVERPRDDRPAPFVERFGGAGSAARTAGEELDVVDGWRRGWARAFAFAPGDHQPEPGRVRRHCPLEYRDRVQMQAGGPLEACNEAPRHDQAERRNSATFADARRRPSCPKAISGPGAEDQRERRADREVAFDERSGAGEQVRAPDRLGVIRRQVG